MNVCVCVCMCDKQLDREKITCDRVFKREGERDKDEEAYRYDAVDVALDAPDAKVEITKRAREIERLRERD